MFSGEEMHVTDAPAAQARSQAAALGNHGPGIDPSHDCRSGAPVINGERVTIDQAETTPAIIASSPMLICISPETRPSRHRRPIDSSAIRLSTIRR
jgi:hypothetical protein